ncbi:phenazine-specific anthranilate synthase component I, partial [Streptomyces sp. NPDC058872]
MDLSRLLDESCPPFALLRRRTPGRDHDTVEVLIGRVHEAERLADLPVGALPTLALVPFRQIRERGFDVRDDGTPLSVLVADEVHELALAEALAALPTHEVRVEGGGFDVSDEEYAETVRRVIAEEIGSGEGANFVIRRTYTGEIPGFGRADALALFRRLLAGERGAYWTFVVHTGERTLIGASPEVHVRMSGGPGGREALSVEGGGGRRAEENSGREALSVEGGGGRRAEENSGREALSVEGGGGR